MFCPWSDTLGGDSLSYIHLFRGNERKKSKTIKNRQHIPDYVKPLLEAEYQRGKKDGRKQGILFCKELIGKGLNVLDGVLQITTEKKDDATNP